MPSFFWTTCNQQIQQAHFMNLQWFQFRWDLTEAETKQLYELVKQIEEPIQQMRTLFWAKEQEAAAQTAATETSSSVVSTTPLP